LHTGEFTSGPKIQILVGQPWRVSPGVQLPPALRREAICTHTLSSGNVRHAQRLHVARVTFPQRLHMGMPLLGEK
jgi:hypothetical protein